MKFQLSDLRKFDKAYLILFFYFIVMTVSATVGHYVDNREGFTNGYVIGIVISLTLWFMVGEKNSGL
jgi:hypothetical protein